MSGLHTTQPQYVYYTGPVPQQQQQQQQHAVPPSVTTVSPQDTQHTPAMPMAVAPPPPPLPLPPPAASAPAPAPAPAPSVPQPVVAKGNWTKDLVQLAKTAELKKHALTLQLHTAHILSAHASLEQKNRAIQDVREQRNKLESERKRLIECLSQVNDDRTQADLLESSLDRERVALSAKIAALSEGEYGAAKAEVDRLRAELGQPPLPSLREMLDGKGAGYLAERRSAGPGASVSGSANPGTAQQSASAGAPKRKRAANGTGGGGNGAGEAGAMGVGDAAAGGGEDGAQAKRPRGRPRGSKNRTPAPAGG